MNRKYVLGLMVVTGIIAVPLLAYAVMSSLVVNGNATIGSGYTSFGAPTDGLLVQGKIVTGSSVSDGAQIQSGGVIESTTGGFKFPDGTTQTTAANSVAPTIVTGSGVASVSFTGLDLDSAKYYHFLIIADLNTAGYLETRFNGLSGSHSWEIKSFNVGQYDSNQTNQGFWRMDNLSTATTQHLIDLKISRATAGGMVLGTWTGQTSRNIAEVGEQALGGGTWKSWTNVTSIEFWSSGPVGTWRVYLLPY